MAMKSDLGLRSLGEQGKARSADSDQAVEVVVVGAGKLALGYVIPLIDRERCHVTVVVRSVEGKYERFKEARSYEWRTDDETDFVNKSVDCVCTYEEAENTGVWEKADVLIVSVGMGNLPDVAAKIASPIQSRLKAYRAKADLRRIKLLAFENGNAPAERLLGYLKEHVGALARDDLIEACNVVVDSVCTAEYGDAHGGIAVTAQKHSDSVIITEADSTCKELSLLLSSGNGTPNIYSKESTVEAEKLGWVLEKKKAWFVNAPDYIASAYSLDCGRMYVSVDAYAREMIEDFCEMATLSLEAMVDCFRLSKELVFGESSFLGTCDQRVRETLETISGREDRSCFDVYGDLGRYFDVFRTYYAVKGNMFGYVRNDEMDRVVEERKRDDAISRAMRGLSELHFQTAAADLKIFYGKLEALLSQDGVGKADLDSARTAMVSGFEGGAEDFLVDLHASANAAAFVDKMHERLSILPELPPLEPGYTEDQRGQWIEETKELRNEFYRSLERCYAEATTEDERLKQIRKTQVPAIAMQLQLKVAGRWMRKPTQRKHKQSTGPAERRGDV